MLKGLIVIGVFAAGLSPAQSPSPAAPTIPADAGTSASPVQPVAAVAIAGGRLHGVVKSGTIPLPGVTVTAQNTLTGKRYATTTDITGAWSMQIPQNGRYVVRTEFAAFAQKAQEAVLNATSHDQQLDFQLVLASRAVQQEQQQAQQQTGANANGIAQAIQQLTGTNPENVSLINSLGTDTEAAAGASSAQGAALPTVATNADFGGESVAITGQSGQVSPMAGVDLDRLRDALETFRAQNGGQFPGGGGLFGGGGGGAFGGGGVMIAVGPGGGAGGPGGPGGPGGAVFFGGFGGGGNRGFRNFNPAQPHGAVFWDGSNSALNAQPFTLHGTPLEQPASGTNRFGVTLMSAPYIPGLTKPSGKDTVFLTLSGQRNSSPQDFYATVPTAAQRGGDFSAAGQPGIYNPLTGQQFSYLGVQNVIPSGQISPQATALLNYMPLPNLTGSNVVNNYNYRLLTTAQSNSTQAGARYMRSLGASMLSAGGGGRSGGGRGGRGTQNQGLRQSINANFNWSHAASDKVNLFPQLGGKTASESYSVQAGYTLGYHRVTSIFSANWNRSNSHTINFFTNTSVNPAFEAGMSIPNNVPLNYGLPSVTLSKFTGLTQTQPVFSISQSLSFSETVSWIRGKHNLRFGGDYRHVHNDFLAGSNSTGQFTFTGLFTQRTTTDASSGSSFADFLLGLPQSTGLNSSLQKSYLRDNVFDAFAMDDWRALSWLTLNYGVRYEFFAPYTEKYGRLSMVDTNPGAGFTQQAQVSAGGVGPVSGVHLPDSLVYPWYKAFAPRVGFAMRLPKRTVLRSGFGMNYTVGEYATFANTMAHQPPFTNLQTNVAAANNQPSTACVQTGTCFTLAKGFTANGQPLGNYALDPNYGLPYLMTWNIDLQKTLPLGIVLNVGYNGSRSNHLDVKLAPRALPVSAATNPAGQIFNYDQSSGFYKMNAVTVRANKRLSHGVSMGANYQFSHAIDNATSVNGSSGTVAQNWLDPAAEAGNSSLVPRHQVSGNYLYELPFGEDRMWATSGKPKRIFEGFSISGTFTFASSTWLTPTYTPTAIGVTCGTAGALRANRVPGTEVVLGGRQWVNPGAYSMPSATPGYCNAFGNAPRNSIAGPGTLQNNMSLSRTIGMGETRSMEVRANINNVFNTVQYTGVDTTVGSPTFGQVSQVGSMRSFQFSARFRF
jgi:hypothetical protein